MKLLVDMNLSPRWVSLLQGSGNEAVHWSIAGAPNAADSEIMAYAERAGLQTELFAHLLMVRIVAAVQRNPGAGVEDERVAPRCALRTAAGHLQFMSCQSGPGILG